MLDVKTVCCATLQHHVFLMRLEKCAVFRPGCDEEEGGKRDYYSDQALNDEDPVVASQFCYPQGSYVPDLPTPSLIASHAFHLG